LENSLPQDLVIVEVNGENRIDSRVLATQLNYEHKIILQSIRRHKDRLEAKSILLHNEAKTTSDSRGRGRPESYYMLDERQCLILAGSLKKGVEADEWHDRLVDAFLDARNRIRELEQTITQEVQELDPIKTAQNPHLLRQAVEQLEDIALAAAKKAQLFKLLEQHYYPKQYRTRGKRNLPQARPVVWNNRQLTQLTIIFEIA